jgi:hypothetical protein
MILASPLTYAGNTLIHIAPWECVRDVTMGEGRLFQAQWDAVDVSIIGRKNVMPRDLFYLRRHVGDYGEI